MEITYVNQKGFTCCAQIGSAGVLQVKRSSAALEFIYVIQ